MKFFRKIRQKLFNEKKLRNNLLYAAGEIILVDIGKQENELAHQREKVLDMFRNNENSIRTIFNLAGVNTELDLSKGSRVSSNLQLLHSKEFENNVLIFILMAYPTENAHYTPLMENLNAILQLLETEVKE
jgi:hypothetical protein